MTDANKYYTPEIEEFHVGTHYQFNAEGEGAGGQWEDAVIKDGAQIDEMFRKYENGLPVYDIRVRHLCHDDMEDCGFTLISSDRYDFQDDWRIHSLMKNNSADYYRIGNHEAFFREGEENDFSMVMIDGLRLTLKSKSDLKRLMKQLGI